MVKTPLMLLQQLQQFSIQPVAVPVFVGHIRPAGVQNAEITARVGRKLRELDPRFITTVARGSSDHAACYAKYLLETRTGLVTSSSGPSVVSVYKTSLKLENSLCLVISQSGASPDLLAMAEAGLAEMRALIFELHPESLANEGLIGALSKQASAIRTRHGIGLQLSLFDEPEIPMELKFLLYRVTQEALHNVVKHAQANQVAVDLTWQEDQISLAIRDDGKGFDPHTQSQGLGLRSMRERVMLVGGEFDVYSKPGEGTVISAKIPLK